MLLIDYTYIYIYIGLCIVEVWKTYGRVIVINIANLVHYYGLFPINLRLVF